MDENEREPRIERETTIIQTGERSSGGLIAIVILILALAVLLFLFFGGYFERAADEVGINVNVEAPEIRVPDVEVPDVDIDVTKEDSGNEV